MYSTNIFNESPSNYVTLAKPHRLDSTKTEQRFELFINGKEICNAYTELNNPIIQKEIKFLNRKMEI